MNAALELKLVPCSREYWDFVRTLRNDPANLPGFVDTTLITAAMQEEYMGKYADHYRICLSRDTPVGFIGDMQGDIRICVDKNWKNQGVSKFMIREYVKGKKNLVAKVKFENQASRRAFESCGFRPKFIIYEI